MKAFLVSTLAAGLTMTSAAVIAQTTTPPTSEAGRAAAEAGRSAAEAGKAAAEAGKAAVTGKKMSGPMTREQHRQQSMDMFKKWDTNGDGNISQQEFMAAQDAKFDRMDTNKDGTVSADERRTHMRTNKDTE